MRFARLERTFLQLAETEDPSFDGARPDDAVPAFNA